MLYLTDSSYMVYYVYLSLSIYIYRERDIYRERFVIIYIYIYIHTYIHTHGRNGCRSLGGNLGAPRGCLLVGCSTCVYVAYLQHLYTQYDRV